MQNTERIEELKEQNQLLISRISHEIRNPIALLRSSLDLLAVRHPEITEFEEWDDILDVMDYIKGLLNDISQFNNASRLKRKPTQLPEFLNSIFHSLRPTMDYLKINFQSDLQIPDISLSIDPIKMRQALLNILRNAYEAVSVNGCIHFVASTKENSLILKIEDNGSGISPEDLSTLFHPFVTHKKEGTGLGLTITKQIIEAHGGTISVQSTPGEGTLFTIVLPMDLQS